MYLKMEKSRNTALRLIAVFKLFKAITLIIVGISALRMIHGDAAATLTHWIARMGFNPDGRYVDRALGKIASLPSSRFKELGIGSFVYSVLFLIEGIGLWMQKRWAEWFTVVITGSLVPLEIYELHLHPTAGKVCMLLVNVGVVVYLLVKIQGGRSSSGVAG